jgi:SAM-dependent methyltransferase
LIDDVLEYAEVKDLGALEIGAGTGKATTAFAERGIRVVAIEPEERMAAVLRPKIAPYPNIKVQICAFEDFEPLQQFNLVYSAGSWHWLDPGQRSQRATAALAARGTLALFWNSHWPSDSVIRERLLAVHRKFAPGILPDQGPMADGRDTSWPRAELLAQPGLGELLERSYLRTRRMSNRDYIAFLSSISRYRTLPENVRIQVLNAVVECIGETIELTVETSLFMARRLVS